MPLSSCSPSPALISLQLRNFLPQPFALPLLFVCLGLIMGSWAGRLPALRASLQLSLVELSLVLLCSGLGAVLSSPLSAQLSSRFKGQRDRRSRLMPAGLAMLLLLMLTGMAPSMPLLMLTVFLLGASASTFDIGINAAAARQERLQSRSMMARLHAFACGGGLAGGMLGSGMAWLQISPVTHFSLIVLPCALLLWLSISALGTDSADGAPPTSRSGFVLPRGGVALLGMLGFLGAMTEGSIANWSGVFMTDHFGASSGFAPLSLSAFSAMMLLSRFYGDQLKRRVGARRLVCGGALIAAVGLYLAVLAPGAWFALAGFAVAGLGLALVFPFVFSAAGQQGSVAIAGVATMTYAGSVIGPPLLGAIAEWQGLQAALAFTGLLPLGIACLGSRVALIR